MKIRRLCAQVGMQWKTSLRQFSRVPPAERSRRKLEQARENEAALDAILSPDQHVRLRQIRLQSEGPGAFREPEVAAALELTAEQLKHIRELEDQATFELMKAAWPGMSAERESAGDALPKQNAIEQILELLTADAAASLDRADRQTVSGIFRPFFPGRQPASRSQERSKLKKGADFQRIESPCLSGSRDEDRLPSRGLQKKSARRRSIDAARASYQKGERARGRDLEASRSPPRRSTASVSQMRLRSQ